MEWQSSSRCNSNMECLFTTKSHIESEANPSVQWLTEDEQLSKHKWWQVLNLFKAFLKRSNFIKRSARISHVMLWGFLTNHVNGNFWTTQIENILTLAYCGHLNFHEPKLGKTRLPFVCVCVGAGVHTLVYLKNFSHYLSSIFIDYNMIVLYCWESLWFILNMNGKQTVLRTVLHYN